MPDESGTVLPSVPHGFVVEGSWAAVNEGVAGAGVDVVAGVVVVAEDVIADAAADALSVRQSYDQEPPEIFEHSPLADQIPMRPSTHSDIVYRRVDPSALGLPSCPHGFPVVGS